MVDLLHSVLSSLLVIRLFIVMTFGCCWFIKVKISCIRKESYINKCIAIVFSFIILSTNILMYE